MIGHEELQLRALVGLCWLPETSAGKRHNSAVITIRLSIPIDNPFDAVAVAL